MGCAQGREVWDCDQKSHWNQRRVARCQFNVNSRDVFDYDPDLYTKMVRYPLEVLAIFDIVLMNIVGRIKPLYFENHIQFKLGFSISRAPLQWEILTHLVSFSFWFLYNFLNPYLTFGIFVLIWGCVFIRCWGYYPDPVVINRGNFILIVVMIIGLICVIVIVFVEMNVFSSCWLVSFVRANKLNPRYAWRKSVKLGTPWHWFTTDTGNS